MLRRLSLFFAVALLLASCGGGGSDRTPLGMVEEDIVPCNGRQPSFDVWRADFAPGERTMIHGHVDTRSEATAAEFRLTVACQGKIVVQTTLGTPCTFPPPKTGDGADPQCPSFSVPIEGIDFDDRIECLAEIGTTESLGEGNNGGCADPGAAGYTFRMSIDGSALHLELLADDCRDEESCLESNFGVTPD